MTHADGCARNSGRPAGDSRSRGGHFQPPSGTRFARSACRAGEPAGAPAGEAPARRDCGRREPGRSRRSVSRAIGPFVERLVAFWSNHLCVSVGAKVLVAPLAGSYEREAIRPHVLGRFEDMVLASAKHPAMLVYLDNFQSIGPSSRGARFGGRGGAPRGLNENYARELLELHTLGVDGGYTQQDVQELAKILTGWTVGGLVRGGGAQGDRWRGRTVRPPVGSGPPSASRSRSCCTSRERRPCSACGTSEAGEEEGERVIRALCRHPSTARFVATKLVRTSSPTTRPRRRSSASLECSATATAIFARSPARSIDLAGGVGRAHAKVPHAAGLAGRGAARVRCRPR